MTPPVVAVLIVVALAAFFTFLLHRLSAWTDPGSDEEFSRIDEELVSRDSFVRQLEEIRSLPSFPLDAERLGS